MTTETWKLTPTTPMNTRLTVMAAIAGVLCGQTFAAAALVGIDLRVPGNLPSHSDAEGGPHWTGIVDTTLDVLTIYTWEEQPNSVDYWSPDQTSLPLVWPAVTSTGAPYDVPDSFDGVIDDAFAFISEQNVHEIRWVQESTEEGGLLLPLVATFYPGWGGARYIPNNQTELVYDTSWTEQDMPKLLVSPNGLGIVAADDGIITVVAPSSISPVPEASPVLIGSLLSGGGLLVGLWRRRPIKDPRLHPDCQ